MIFALLVTILVFSSGRNNGVANLFGYIPLTVESDSMMPTFGQGDLIICKEIDDMMQLKEDDVITFWTIIDGKKVKNTHRIVKVNEFENTRSLIKGRRKGHEFPPHENRILCMYSDTNGHFLPL